MELNRVEMSPKKTSQNSKTELLDDEDISSSRITRAAQREQYDQNNNPKFPEDKKDRGLLEKLRSHMSAIAYAEAGDHTTAWEFLEPPVQKTTVLLVIKGTDMPRYTLTHALNLCRRTESRLDILQIVHDSPDDPNHERVRRALSKVAGNILTLLNEINDEKIPVKVTMKRGDADQKLINYTRRHNEVKMVILEGPKGKEASGDQKSWKKIVEQLAQKIPVPLITVDPKEPACAQ